MRQPDRSFQVWAYSASHRRLLLRSNIDQGAATRIDVLFTNVRWMNLPTRLNGLVIRKGGTGDSVPGWTVPAGSSSGHLYRIEGKDYEAYLVADGMQTHEDREDYDAPSPLDIGWSSH